MRNRRLFTPDLLLLRVDDDEVGAVVGAGLLGVGPAQRAAGEGVAALLEELPAGQASPAALHRLAQQRWGGERRRRSAQDRLSKPRGRPRGSPSHPTGGSGRTGVGGTSGGLHLPRPAARRGAGAWRRAAASAPAASPPAPAALGRGAGKGGEGPAAGPAPPGFLLFTRILRFTPRFLTFPPTTHNFPSLYPNLELFPPNFSLSPPNQQLLEEKSHFPSVYPQSGSEAAPGPTLGPILGAVGPQQLQLGQDLGVCGGRGGDGRGEDAPGGAAARSPRSGLWGGMRVEMPEPTWNALGWGGVGVGEICPIWG